MARTEAISLRVEEAVKKALQAAADADGRTLAQYVERVLVAHLEVRTDSRIARSTPRSR